MTTHNNGVKKQSIINILHFSLFSIFMACMLLLSGCGGGGNGSSSNPSNIPADITSPIESIVLVSPTESGAIDVVMGYKQKILVAGIAKNGTRKLLTAQDGLAFKLATAQDYASIESGVISGNLVGSTTLSINLNGRLFINNIPVNVVQAKLQGITIFANNSSSNSAITLPESYNVMLVAEGKFDDKVRNISAYTNLWSSVNPKVTFESDTTFGASLFAGVSGQTEITAKESSIESSINVTVVKAKLDNISINPNNVIIPLSSNTQMKASANFNYNNESSFNLDITDSVLWSLESTQIASINTAGILTTGAESGNIIVKAKATTGESTTANLIVSNPIVKSVFLSNQESGLPVSFIAVIKGLSTTVYPYAKYSDGSTHSINLNNPDCKLYAGESGFIKIEKNDTSAIIRGENVGNTSVALSCNNDTIKYTANATVTNAIIESITIEPAIVPPLASGKNKKLYAVAYYSDGESNSNITASWGSESTAIATVDSTGLVTAHSIGSTTITAKVVDQNNGNKEIFANKTVEATSASLISIQITIDSSANPTTIVSGLTKSIQAIGVYSDNSTKDLTQWVTWNCESTVVTCGWNNNEHIGQITAESVTTDTITTVYATYGKSSPSNYVSVKVEPVDIAELVVNNKACPSYVGTIACTVEYFAKYNNGAYTPYTNIESSNITIAPKCNPNGYNVNNWPSIGKLPAILSFSCPTIPASVISVTASTTDRNGKVISTGKVDIPVQ